MGIFKKIPDWGSVASVYAVIVMFVYGWTIYWFLWKFRSWTYYLPFSEILVNSAYSAVLNFFESLFVLLILLALAMLLPRSWFLEHFVSVGALLSAMLGGYLIYFSSATVAEEVFSYTPLIFSGIYFLLALVFSMILGRSRLLSGWVEAFADRARIFLYISIPVSLFSLPVVLIRNLIK